MSVFKISYILFFIYQLNIMEKFRANSLQLSAYSSCIYKAVKANKGCDMQVPHKTAQPLLMRATHCFESST